MTEEKQYRLDTPLNPDKDFYGFKMRTRKDYYDERALKEELGPNKGFYRMPNEPKVVIDIGGHLGGTSLEAAKKGATVYTFEPEQYNFETLVYNVNLNGFQDKINCINLGVGKHGLTKLYVSDCMSGGTGAFLKEVGLAEDRYQNVQFISIKDVFKNYNIEHCDFLKIDCEGSEEDIITDLDDELVSKIDQISVEIHFRNSIKRLIDVLSKWYVCEKSHRRIWVCTKKKRLMVTEYENLTRIAIEIAGKNSKKLKTDVYNEIFNKGSVYDLLTPNVYFLDINQGYCDTMKEKYPGLDVRVGDIRKIPFEDKEFDMVLDLSTIDHIPDYELALIEYSRILKPGGVLALSVWTTPEKTIQRKQQYWHNFNEFDITINKIFNKIASNRFIKGHGFLMWYLMRNR